MMSKILLIGENDSIWTRRCIMHSDILNDNDVYVLEYEPSENDSFYKQHGIKICRIKRHKLFGNIPKVRGIVRRIDRSIYISSLAKKVGGFDVVHISFVSKDKVSMIKRLRKRSKKMICTFWGSDLFRVSDKQLLKYRSSLALVDNFTLSTPEMKQRFISVFGKKLGKKIIKLHFGNEGLAYIDPDNTAKARSEFGVPEGKTVITIGHGGKECHNHIKVINALKKLDKQHKDKLFIQLPVTYGLTPEYKQRLIQSLRSLGCEYSLVETFLDDKRLGTLRESADVFIHAQPTDAFSASVQEYLYAQKLVFNPVWIQYQELKDKGVYYREYKDFDELSQMISDYLENGLSSEIKQRISENSKIIQNNYSWDAVSDNWHRLYQLNKRGVSNDRSR